MATASVSRRVRASARRRAPARGVGLIEVLVAVLVLAIGLLLHKPLSKVPENSLKFVVGSILTGFGVFWSGEGLGVNWPGGDWTILALVALYGLAGLALAMALRGRRLKAA